MSSFSEVKFKNSTSSGVHISQIGILYNDCYGGFEISKKAMEMYKNRKNNLHYLQHYSHHVSRTDPILIEIYNEIGQDEFSRKPISNIEIKYIDEKYKNFFIINEYDGLEDIEILYDAYLLFNVRKIIFDEKMDKEEKIIRITDLLENKVDSGGNNMFQMET